MQQRHPGLRRTIVFPRRQRFLAIANVAVGKALDIFREFTNKTVNVPIHHLSVRCATASERPYGCMLVNALCSPEFPALETCRLEVLSDRGCECAADGAEVDSVGIETCDHVTTRTIDLKICLDGWKKPYVDVRIEWSLWWDRDREEVEMYKMGLENEQLRYLGVKRQARFLGML